jgi:hypothetical protein
VIGPKVALMRSHSLLARASDGTRLNGIESLCGIGRNGSIRMTPRGSASPQVSGRTCGVDSYIEICGDQAAARQLTAACHWPLT